MGKLRIQGGLPLAGSITVQGSKNMALPILCACLLIPEEVVLYGCPRISDVEETAELLRGLGASVTWQGDALVCNCRNVCSTDICGELTGKSRMSVLLFGAALARCHQGRMEYPGGCNIGSRPIDMHETMFRTLGAKLTREGNTLRGVTTGFRGTTVVFDRCSVGATENAVLCAALAEGTTRICGAAGEPEVEGLCDFLRSAGAKIVWTRKTELVVEGVKHLHGLCYRVASDRIVAGTYLAATAITKGSCELLHAPVAHMKSILALFAKLGCGIVTERERIYMESPYRLVGGQRLRTEPYPGFPTDMQPFAAALLSVADGGSTLQETIFEHRFQAMEEMNRMGADLRIAPPCVLATGNAKLHGAHVRGKDLRGSAALAVLALGAQGESLVEGMEYIRRGYEDFAGDLRRLGAKCVEEE